jgi:hypothetical protein
VYQREHNYPSALAMIAEGLSLDKTGQFRDRLMQKQNELVAQQTRRHQQEYLLLVNLVSRYQAGDPKKDKPKQEEEIGAAGPQT